MKYIRSLLLRLMVFPVLGVALAAKPVRNGAVRVELVSAVASIQPGQPFTVAVSMHHDPHWHTYWMNAGTGYPTSVEWQLPEGFRAEPIQWPVPKVFRNASGKTTGYGYEGENLLMVKVTPPTTLVAGADITLQAHAEWLMCQEVCMPGSADLSLTLAVRDQQPVRDEFWGKRIAEFNGRLPVSLPPGWTAAATRKGNVLELHLTVGSGARPPVPSLYFFSADGLVDYEQLQAVRMVPGGYVFRLTLAESADPKAARLVGVIRADNGWGMPGEDFGLKGDSGIMIDASIGH